MTLALLVGEVVFLKRFITEGQVGLFVLLLGLALAAVEEWRQVRRGAGTAIVEKWISPYTISSLIFDVLLLGTIVGLLVGVGTSNLIFWSVIGMLVLITGLPWLWGPAPGFYPARQDASLEQWWNGKEWSEITRPKPINPLAAWVTKTDGLTLVAIALTFFLYLIPLLALLASHLRPTMAPEAGHTFTFFTLVLLLASIALSVSLILLWRGKEAIPRAISAGILLIYGAALCGYGIEMIHEDLQIRGEKFDGLGAFLGMLVIVYASPLLVGSTLLLIQAGRRIIGRGKANLTFADEHGAGH